MKKLNDIEIIESVLRGNQGDYALLVDRYKDRAFTLLKRMLRNEMDAEEALQDSFMRAFNALKNFKKDSKFSTWFYRIVYNTGLSMLSSRHRQNETLAASIDDHLELHAEDQMGLLERAEVAEFVTALLEKMPPKYAAVINLFYSDEMTIDEISKVTGQSLVNVKVILHRGRNMLRELLLKHNYQEVMR